MDQAIEHLISDGEYELNKSMALKLLEEAPKSASIDVSRELPSQGLVDLAKAYFMRASMEFPASTIAQGARIAAFAKQSGQDPAKMGIALINDRMQVEEITRQAIQRHRDRGVPDGKTKVTVPKMVGIIATDFEKASLYLDFSDEDLQKIAELHAQAKARGRGRYNDFIIDNGGPLMAQERKLRNEQESAFDVR